MSDKLNEVTKALFREQSVAERVDAMGIEKDGKQHILYMTKTELGRHWFAIPLHEAKSLNEQEDATTLLRWLDLEQS